MGDLIDYELGVITSMGYAGYFLIVADFVRFVGQSAIESIIDADFTAFQPFERYGFNKAVAR
jgi:hypothetical protein